MQLGVLYRLENVIQFDPNNTCPTFAYSISRQQHLQLIDQTQISAGSVFSPAALVTSVTTDDFDASMFLTRIDEGDWSDVLDFFALTAAKC
jgi:hypothetical protein